ncbi:MAG: ATP-binding cassette domain-containing protein [candidate division Zixibacteria bacterium]|nr:ATP-binding cassette domain-containing protein [candidate division Zixibacteria bacterium]
MNLLYSLKNINLRYPCIGSLPDDDNKSILALDNLSLDIFENEHLVIQGSNGSGKSSLAGLLAGIAQNISGEIYYKEHKIETYSRQAFENVALVIQEPQNQLLMPTVAKELSFPLENRGYERQAIERKIAEMAELFDLKKLLRQNTDELSGGQTTALAIASAMITDPETIILDEPDSHLDSKAKKVIHEFINQYRDMKTIIIITQFPESARGADRLIILNQGRLADDSKPDDIMANDRIITANQPAALKPISIPKENTKIKYDNSDKVILTLNDISFAYMENKPVLNKISLSIHQNEKVALIGPSGSGKTTLGLIMAGLLQPDSGAVKAGDITLDEFPPGSLRQLVTMALQFPERAFIEETVESDIAFGPQNMGYADISKIVENKLTAFQIGKLRQQHPLTLSGGEKRKAALAGILAMESEITILDEPSAALDPASTNKLINLLNSNNDKTFIVISHDIKFIAKTCSRVIGLNHGSIVYDIPAADFFDNRDLFFSSDFQ